jgi:hypothetical protein
MKVFVAAIALGVSIALIVDRAFELTRRMNKARGGDRIPISVKGPTWIPAIIDRKPAFWNYGKHENDS